MRHRCKPIGGSNPSLSATLKWLQESPVNKAFLHDRSFRVAPECSPKLPRVGTKDNSRLSVCGCGFDRDSVPTVLRSEA
jgi:hypothetical protein